MRLWAAAAFLTHPSRSFSDTELASLRLLPGACEDRSGAWVADAVHFAFAVLLCITARAVELATLISTASNDRPVLQACWPGAYIVYLPL